jgi:DNA-binding NarL/FixJ family response regulator
MRQGLVSLFDSTEDLRVVAHTASIDEAVRLVHDFRPDIVIVDADAVAASGGAGIEQLRGTPVLVLAEDVTFGRVELALRAGVRGYTLTSVSFTELLDAVRQVAEGRVALHPEAASAVAMSAVGRGASGDGRLALTPRQSQILTLMAGGLQNKQIARQLGIGSQTVKTHVSRILQRLDTMSRTEAVALAMREGLVA